MNYRDIARYATVVAAEDPPVLTRLGDVHQLACRINWVNSAAVVRNWLQRFRRT